MSKEILGFRLRSGEDIIGQVVDDKQSAYLNAGTDHEAGIYILYRPAVPVNVPQKDPNTGQAIGNGQGLTMLKWAPFADQEEFTFGPDDYVGQPYKIWGELEKYYLESTSTIALASAGSVPKQQING